MAAAGSPRQLPAIAEASSADLLGMARTLAAAFGDDPAMAWIMPDRADRLRRFERFFPLMVRGDLAAGAALTSPGCEAVTLWRPSDKVGRSPLQTLLALPSFIRALGAALPRAMAVGDAIDAHHPHGFAYSYLHFAGVDPAFQGLGWGGAAIRAGQDRARTAGLPVYLETATASNVGLYQLLGFEVTGEFDVRTRKAGPHFWSMLWRPA